jgi:hypothetical protein
METEHDIQNNIRLTLSKLGWCCFRINSGKVKMMDGRWFETGVPPGFSDLIALKDGKTVFIEVKAKKGKATKKQLHFLDQMRKRGFAADVVHSVDEAIKLINGDWRLQK